MIVQHPKEEQGQIVKGRLGERRREGRRCKMVSVEQDRRDDGNRRSGLDRRMAL